jgi:simple sugar transport system permease protein
MVAISIMLAVLSKGASSIQTTLGVPASISDIITGIILLCMLGCEFFINYKMIFRGKEEHHEEAVPVKPAPAAGEEAAK